MSLSQSSEINLTDNGKRALNAQALANSARSAAENAYDLANNAQKTADGKNRVYRGLNPNTVPTADLKAGDLYFTNNAVYTWTGSTWEKTVSDTTGEEIHAKVEKAMAEKDKAIAELDASIKAKVAEIDKEIEDNKIQTGNALNFYKEQYYLSNSYTELTGGNWSDEVPTKTPGKYVWSRYVTANIGDPTNRQYSDPVCISGLDGEDGAPGPQGPQGVSSYTHIAYANSADGRLGFDVSNSAGKAYIGIYVDSNAEGSTDPTKYMWTLIKGERGDQGIPGPRGADGRTPYFHIAYANSSDGTIGFDVSNSDGKLYIGQYTDYTQADSTNPASYKWTKIKGDTGATGPQGPKGEPGQTGFFTGTTPPSNPAKGSVWATTDSSGNMVSAKTWDGSSWVSTAFTQDLVAGTISATKIQGGELDINKITVKNAQNMPITSNVSLGQKLSDIKQDADGLTATVIGGGNNLLNNSSDTLKTFTGQEWMKESSESDIIPTHSIDGNEVTLSAWIEKPSKEAWVQMWTDKGLFQGNKIPAGGSGWSQVTYTMPSGWSAWNVVVGCGDGSGEVTFGYKDVKLELGPNRTAWKPSNGDIAQLKLTSDGLNAYVKGSKGSDTLKAILSMDPDHSSIAQVVNGQIAAAISTHSDGSVRIDGKALYINSHAKIDDATIKSAMIDSIEANKIKGGTLDASQITVTNLDANSITTGSLSAVVNDLRQFKTYVVSDSNTWNFDYTKSSYGNWFLIGETTADHVYNGPSYPNGQKLTPYMYVTSRGPEDCSSITVTVWKDNDPTQYQRVWDVHSGKWSDWVMLPNSQNIVSAINLSPDSVKIDGKNIELNGNTTIHGQLNLLPTDQRYVDQRVQGFHNPWAWQDANVFAGSGGLQLQSTIVSQSYSDDNTSISGLRGSSSAAITTLAPTYLKFTVYPSWDDVNKNFSNQLCRTYIDAGRIETNDVQAGDFRFTGSKMRGLNGSLYVTNWHGTNFDNAGSAGFQVWGGIGLGKGTIYTPDTDIFIQQGNVGPAFGQSYNSANKTTIHAQKLISQEANSVSSRLSVKTDITPVTYDRALDAVMGTDMYDYRYTSDKSGQHYVSGIIDDVNPEPQYHMDDMLINKERTARIDANLIGYHHVILQELIKKIDELEIKVKSLETRLESKEK